jgi:PilZ domain
METARRVLRHPLVVDVEVTNLESEIRIRERTKDLSLYGCGVSTVTPFPAGTKVKVKVAYGRKEIVAFGKVIYGRRDIGMGIVFTTIEPDDQKLLEDWFAELAILE